MTVLPPELDDRFDEVAIEDIEFHSAEEAREWFRYSLLVLAPRGRDLERRARRLIFGPLFYFRWRRAHRAWEANTARMEAIIDANQRWLDGAR